MGKIGRKCVHYHAPGSAGDAWRMWRFVFYALALAGLGVWYARENRLGHQSGEVLRLRELRRSGKGLPREEMERVYDEILASCGDRDDFENRELAEWARIGKSSTAADLDESDAILAGVVERSLADPNLGLHRWGGDALRRLLAQTEEREERARILDGVLTKHGDNRTYIVQPVLCDVWMRRFDEAESPGEARSILKAFEVWIDDLPSLRDFKRARTWMAEKQAELEAEPGGGE